MHLIEIFLPTHDNSGKAFKLSHFEMLRSGLAERFGGVTAFMRSPAKGAAREHGKTVQDDIIIFEVMSDNLDRDWWRQLKTKLENDFMQKEILIRISSVEKLT